MSVTLTDYFLFHHFCFVILAKHITFFKFLFVAMEEKKKIIKQQKCEKEKEDEAETSSDTENASLFCFHILFSNTFKS